MLDVWCARDGSDAPAYMTCGISCPRQNGKNGVLEAFEFYKMVACGERILHTAHQVKTANKSFQRLAALFTNPAHPEVCQMVDNVRRTNGEQAIYLTNGGLVEYSARSRGASRGNTYSCVVYDEAQELTDEQTEALMSTIAASPSGYRQLVYLGTPPGPSCPGNVFSRVRNSAIGGAAQTTSWHEWSVEDLPSASATFADVLDSCYDTNPALGIRLDEGFTRTEFETMSLDGFARERLGWWAPTAAALEAAIPAKLWERTAIDAIGEGYTGRVAFGLKFSPDGSSYALAGCKLGRDGTAAVELVELGGTASGTKALARALAERAPRASVVVVDGMSGASALCDNLAEERVPRGYVRRPRTAEVIAAAQGLLDGVADGSVRHTRQPALDDSALCRRRPIGSRGGWGFGDAGEHTSTAIEAVALALWGARNTRRDPRRKQRLL